MLNYLLVTAILCFSCSLYLGSAQPSGSPTPDYYLFAGNPLPTSWMWPKASIGALQPGKTYVLGGRIDSLTLGYAMFNVSFTYSSSCTATSYNSAGPAGNQGWEYTFTQYGTTTEMPATPSPSVATWTGPTTFGTSRALKVHLYMNYFDVCNCITVNWIGFITSDAPGTYNAHDWNSGSHKRSQNNTLEKRCKREDLEKRGPSIGKRDDKCTTAQAGQLGVCATTGYCGLLCQEYPCANFAKGNTQVYPIINSGQPVTKRTNYYLYWINTAGTRACAGIPTIGSYGHGVTGSVTTSPALGTTYL